MERCGASVRWDWRFTLLILFRFPCLALLLAGTAPVVVGALGHERAVAPAADTVKPDAKTASRWSSNRKRSAGASCGLPKRTENPRRVVWLAEAHKRLFGATSVPEAQERGLALETADGRLIPLFEDERGRAFRVDKRLRDMTVELLVRRYEASPVVQILGVHEIKADGRHEVDYWCDVCAIAMYELKPCECCQAEPRLRLRAKESKE